MSSSRPDLGTVLSVWAHPDDESYCCAGLMAEAVAHGQRVTCVTATRGELGSTDEERWPPGPALAQVRTRELAACLAELGVSEHIWLDYPDGGCADIDDAAAIARLREIAERVQPDTVLTFGPDGATWHPDHMAVSRWTTQALRGTGAKVHYTSITPQWYELLSQYVDPAMVMMTDKAPLVHPVEALSIHTVLDGALLDTKERAMRCQESQIGPMLALLGEDNFRRMLAEESFRPAAAEPIG